MTNPNENTEPKFDRRTVLRGAAAAGALGAVGLPAISGSAVASSHTTETLYLSSSEPVSDGQQTRLFTVDLNTSTEEAELTEIFVTTDPDFQRVDAIAASLDGTTIYLIDRDSSHLGTYDLGSDTFTDLGEISGLPSLTVLAAFSPSGELYVASNPTDSLYTIDISGPTANLVTAISGVDVNGADIVFDAFGTLFLHSNSDDTLYTVDYDPTSSTFGDATAVGSASGVSVTGLAVRDAGNGDLVGSSRTRDAIVVFDKSNGSEGTNFDMVVDGNPYDYLNGDMSVGALDVCEECDVEGLVAKFEFECDEETEECTFVLEEGSDEYVSFDSFESKEDDENEPITATFGTEYCELYAVVKSGQDIEVQSFGDLYTEDSVTVVNSDPYAISFVAFYCTEVEAEAAAESFPSQ